MPESEKPVTEAVAETTRIANALAIGRKQSLAVLEEYEHHGRKVTVRSVLRGQHRDHCLCYDCGKFNEADRAANCPIANAVHDNCVKYGIVSPVWECPEYVKKAA